MYSAADPIIPANAKARTQFDAVGQYRLANMR
jgi:hypothetical protein